MTTRSIVPLTTNTEGIYSVNAPYTIDTTVIYRCEAIRTFPELVRRGIDVFTEYYVPVGLSAEEYQADAGIGASIVTLKSADGQVLYIPNTYIATIPGQTGLDYQRVVVVLDCGPTPGYVNFDLISAELKEVIMRHVGVTSDTTITSLAYEGAFTDADHIRMETLRKQNIRQNVPISEQLAAANAKILALTETNAKLVTVIKSAGLSN